MISDIGNASGSRRLRALLQPAPRAIIRAMKSRGLSDFEERLERLIEGGFNRLFRGSLQPREIAIQLLRAIEDNIVLVADDREAAPTHYEIRLSPHDHAALLADTPALGVELSRQVIQYCQESGFFLHAPPEIILLADPAMSINAPRVTATHAVDKYNTTQIMDRIPVQEPQARPPSDAQLIVDGKRTVPLSSEIFNIGRHPDNDLVLGDLRISRHHVQIRLRHGRYLLFDRHSRAGTYVNGQRVTEYMLSSGDVIRLGSVSILYMEDDDTSGLTDTQVDMLPPDLPEGL